MVYDIASAGRTVFGDFASTIFNQKYAQVKANGEKESWEECSARVVGSVMGPSNDDGAKEAALALVSSRRLMPAGRYLYCAGRPYHQTNNCFLFSAEDTRQGWGDLMRKVTEALMTGGGIGVVYSRVREQGALVGGMGGLASGPVSLMEMVNEVGRRVRQGGSRRSAIWAGLHWNHADIHAFLGIKNWPKWLIEQKSLDFNTPAPMDGTNVSVILDDEFFRAYRDNRHGQHALAQEVYWRTVRQMCKTGEPGFSIDINGHSGEHLRNACVTGDTRILTDKGYFRIDSLVGKEVNVWNGTSWAPAQPKVTGYDQPLVRVHLSDGTALTCTYAHKWLVNGGTYQKPTQDRVEAIDLKPGDRLVKHEMPVVEAGTPFPLAYTHGFYCGDGFDYNERKRAWLYGDKKALAPNLTGVVAEEVLDRIHVYFPSEMPPKFDVPHSADVKGRLEWLAGLMDADGTVVQNPNSVSLQMVSVNLPFLQEVRLLLTTLGVQGKIGLMAEEGDKSLPDGKGGHKLYHCQTSYRLCVNAADTCKLFDLGFSPRRLKVDKRKPNRDARRFVEVVSVEDAGVAPVVYCFTEPLTSKGTFEGIVTGQCTEVTSRTDSDVCNLASLNLSRFATLDEFAAAIDPAIGFLLSNTLYSDLPLKEMHRVRDVNRRLGLGLMGLHEWLLLRRKPYGEDAELARWLEVYEAESDAAARRWAKKLSVNVPIATRAVAPTGTISIVAETTSGIEPIFATAYKRRYLKGDVWHAQYVIDAAAKRVVDRGVSPGLIEDAYDLSADITRRLEFQAFVQRYVDQGISSTINLPEWGSSQNNESTVPRFGETLMQYLPKLRGITAYPDGSRGGQPLNKVPYAEAAGQEGVEFAETGNESSCAGGVCGA